MLSFSRTSTVAILCDRPMMSGLPRTATPLPVPPFFFFLGCCCCFPFASLRGCGLRVGQHLRLGGDTEKAGPEREGQPQSGNEFRRTCLRLIFDLSSFICGGGLHLICAYLTRDHYDLARRCIADLRIESAAVRTQHMRNDLSPNPLLLTYPY
jgi:hypothetical protein